MADAKVGNWRGKFWGSCCETFLRNKPELLRQIETRRIQESRGADERRSAWEGKKAAFSRGGGLLAGGGGMEAIARGRLSGSFGIGPVGRRQTAAILKRSLRF